MKQLIIDRFEGQYAVCEDEEQKCVVFALAKLPEGASPGNVLCVTDEGELILDLEETERRRRRILEKQSRAFGG